MRPTLCGILILGGTFLLAGGLEPASTSENGPDVSPWRRTVHGWENMLAWRPRPTPYQPSLHPATVAAFQLLTSLLALVACGSRTCAQRPARASRVAENVDSRQVWLQYYVAQAAGLLQP